MKESTVVTREQPSPEAGALRRSYRRDTEALVSAYERCLAISRSEHTQRAYLYAVKDFCDFIGSDNLLDITRTQVRQYLAHLSGRAASNQTIAHRLAGLKHFFNFLHKYELMDEPPTLLIRLKRKPAKLPRVLSEKQTEALIEAADSPRDRAILEFLYATGCRVGEIVQVKVEDVDFSERVVLLHGKGSKDRIVPFGQKASKALTKYLNGRTTGQLFELGVRQVGVRLSKIALRAGIGHLNPHALRHSYATHLLNRGVNIRYLCELLGHSSITTTQIYTHLALSNLTEVIQRYHPREQSG